ncbi:MAG: class I SAM-dependent methyltransferase [Cyclobacteriaceae bacterium]|nr:class I SAM-dependent methyltransferase [Cyclobacteriaceae bacterium]MCB0500457.1 class I SAM-dependent methyltransferase [Cyclobacteriaceae bacterium]MCB9236728.1 class I SAM-dependent methyltransferase [Flammeovirgaceae bacterium]MCO5272387.1 class I SAM-dependent methyltransferase [Cyclobacteriaceae bacterium]MCW5902007.1 class I SAM-dependent methyltransferase [Cyclobacteriaceae bacterium]
MNLQPLASYLSHWLHRVDEHSIHSPFFFDFYNQVIKKSRKATGHPRIERLRNTLLKDQTPVPNDDPGAGPRLDKKGKKTISRIAKNSLSPPWASRLYQRIIQYNDSKNIVELGTSLGLNTLYLAEKEGARVSTFEGSTALAHMALTHFGLFEKENINLIEGNIDRTLPEFLQNTGKIDFALMDANHRHEPTLRYFNLLARRLTDKSILAVDDIHWSREMERAWETLHRHELVYGSIDLYRCGLLFFDPALNKQHFILSA